MVSVSRTGIRNMVILSKIENVSITVIKKTVKLIEKVCIQVEVIYITIFDSRNTKDCMSVNF